MATFIFPQASELAQAALLAARYNAAKMDLIKSTIALTPTLVLADLTAIVADFTGYAQGVLPAGNPVPFPDQTRNGVSFTLPTTTFAVGATPTVGNDVYGVYIQTGMGSNLIFALLFDRPYPMQNALDTMNLEFNVNMYGDNEISVTINGQPY